MYEEKKLDGVITIFNFLAMLFHVSLAVLSSIFGDIEKTSNLYYPFTVFGDGETDAVSIKNGGTFPMTIIFISYFSVTAFFHFGNCCLWNHKYFCCLRKKRNPFRWAEYSITAPLMTSILAVISGSRNYILIIAACVLTFSTISFGIALDDTKNFMYILYGMVPFLVEFGLITTSLYVSTDCYPSFIPITIFVEFGLWSLFPLVAVLDTFAISYEAGELLYIVLSFVSKSVLVIILMVEGVLKDGIVGTC